MKRKLFTLIITFAVFISQLQFTSNAESNSVSQGAENIVKRAYQMTDIRWTPLEDINGWNGGVVYRSGVTYTGLPYGQPVYACYVPWNATIDEFIAATDDPNSKMYTDCSTYNKTAPYYSIDCSAFVSWAWGLSSRQTTRSLHYFATQISDSDYQDMEIGDALCKAGSHAVLVTDIKYDKSGNITEVEISESAVVKANSYCCLKTRYGKELNLTLDDFYSKYFLNGYILYRCNSRDTVTYTHNCNVPLTGDVCTRCGVGTEPSLSSSVSDTETMVAENTAEITAVALLIFTIAVLICVSLVSVQVRRRKTDSTTSDFDEENTK